MLLAATPPVSVYPAGAGPESQSDADIMLRVKVGDQSVAPVPRSAARLGVRVVWQDLALSDNLDVAANVMLGNERRMHLFSEVALHKATKAA